MILADKIIYLRKKAGWSQEELAEKMEVSRQSISKWEGALSVPDMNRILKLSELFDVSTDYLLRDEMEEEEKNPAADEKIADETGEKLVPVSMELANDYLAHCQKVSVPCAFGVFLCIMSPVFLLLLSGAGEAGLLPLTEDQGALLGTTILILLIVAAVSIFVITGHYDEKYDFLEKEALDTAYGVDGMVRDRKQKYERGHVIELAAGVALCVASCIPIFLMILLFGEENVMALTGAISLLCDSCISAGQLSDHGVAYYLGDLAGGRNRVGCSQQHLPESGGAVSRNLKILLFTPRGQDYNKGRKKKEEVQNGIFRSCKRTVFL